jgi:hypothetical protein
MTKPYPKQITCSKEYPIPKKFTMTSFMAQITLFDQKQTIIHR